MRVFNINTTYECDNRCQHCISHNTRRRTPTTFSIEQTKAFLDRYRPKREDIVIVSGGEPTRHPNFLELTRTLETSAARTFLFTSGIAFADQQFAQAALPTVDRVTFSLYGDSNEHNRLTGNPIAFQRLRAGFRHCVAMCRGTSPHVGVEIRIVASPSLATQNCSIPRLLESIVEDALPDSITLSRILVDQDRDKQSRSKMHAYAAEQLERLKESHIWRAVPTKLVDYLPCLLGSRYFRDIQASRPTYINRAVFFFDGANPGGRELRSFHTATFFKRCTGCFAQRYCGTTLTCYGAIMRNRENVWTHVPE